MSLLLLGQRVLPQQMKNKVEGWIYLQKGKHLIQFYDSMLPELKRREVWGPMILSKVLYKGGFWRAVFGLLAASKTTPLKLHPKTAPKKPYP